MSESKKTKKKTHAPAKAHTMQKYQEGLRLPPQKPEPKTEEQEELIASLEKNTLTVCDGPAGCGKTYITCNYAAWALAQGLVHKILITRPAVPALGENLGFLPGTSDEKMAPYLFPVISYFEEIFGVEEVKVMIETKTIMMVPLSFMRGTTWNNTFIIGDEFQNATKEQVRLLLTRVGYRTRVVIEGDLNQSDLFGRDNGLSDAADKLIHTDFVGVVHLTNKSIVRSKFVKDIEERYQASIQQEREEKQEKAAKAIKAKVLLNESMPSSFGNA